LGHTRSLDPRRKSLTRELLAFLGDPHRNPKLPRTMTLGLKVPVVKRMNASHREEPIATSRLKSALPILEWLGGYRNDWLRPDITAGLTAAAVSSRKRWRTRPSLDYPVQVGLYTAFLTDDHLCCVDHLPERSALALPQTPRDSWSRRSSALCIPKGRRASLLSTSAMLTLVGGSHPRKCCFTSAY